MKLQDKNYDRHHHNNHKVRANRLFYPLCKLRKFFLVNNPRIDLFRFLSPLKIILC